MSTSLLPAGPAPAGGELLRTEQARTLLRGHQLRFAGASAFLALFAVLELGLRLESWHTNLALFAGYWAAAGVVLWLGGGARTSDAVRNALGLAVAFLDLPVVFFLQLSTFPHSNASGVAGFNLGVYVFLLLLAALSLSPRALALTTVVAIALEGELQHLAGVDPGAIVAAALVLGLTGMACAHARRRLVALIEQLAENAEQEQLLKELATKTREQSYLDPLTGLYNRRGFVAFGEQQLAAAARTGTRYVVVFLDLDGLKVINDELGHAEGDAAIRDAADVLRATLREADLVARLGGDEFVALAADAQGTSQGGLKIIDRLAGKMAAFNDGIERPYRLQMSAGAASFDPVAPRGLEALLAEADAAMYAQKKTRPSRREAPVLRLPEASGVRVLAQLVPSERASSANTEPSKGASSLGTSI